MTKTPFGVWSNGEMITIKSRKDLAVKFAIAQDCDYVSNPAGQVVWTNPESDVQASKELETWVAETVAETEEKEQDSSMTITEEAPVTETAEPAVAVVKTRNKATRATAQPASATSGRFLLATYDKSAGETGYAKRPDAILRSMLGIKWRELWALGFTQKTATEVLAGIAAGEIDPDAFVAETLDELDALKEQEAAETA